MRPFLAASALVSCLPVFQLHAQAGMQDVVWGAGANRIVAFDRVGEVVHRQNVTVDALRRAPDGALWTIRRNPPLLERRARDGSLLRAIAIGSSPVSLAVDRAGDCWLGFANPARLERWTRTGQRAAAALLPAAPTALCLDQDGRVWAALATSPLRVARYDPAAASLAMFGIASGLTGAAAIEAAFAPVGPSGIWLVGRGANELVGIDGNGAVRTVVTLGDDPNETMLGIAVLAGGDVLVRGARLYRFGLAARRVDVVHASATASFAVDGSGRLWVATPLQLRSIDLATGRPDVAVPSSPPLDLTGGGGYARAQVVATRDDDDGDGRANRDELLAGTVPYDAQSNATVHLGTSRARYRHAQTLDVEVAGAGGTAAVVFAFGALAPPATVPGVLGDLLLAPARVAAATPALAVPGGFSLPIPDDATLQVDLALQAVHFGPAIARFSNAIRVAVRGRTPMRVSETFANDLQLDKPVSSGTWSGNRGTPGSLGGTGRHGSFDPAIGRRLGDDTFLFDTDDTTIPPTHTQLGTTERVRDGRFEFTDFVVPQGVYVSFRGAHPAVIAVRGEVRIDGVLSLTGESANPNFDPSALFLGGAWVPNPGEPATRGGAGGGDGGAGATSCEGRGVRPEFSGRPGETLQAPAASGYAGVVAGTAGRGGPLFPADGQNASVTFGLVLGSGQLAGGGGGGAFLGAGQDGVALRTSGNRSRDLGPPGLGGAAVSFLRLPPGRTVLDHFLVGGSGGAGGGSQPLGMPREQIAANRPWQAGAAGSAGGGALSFRVGRSMTVGPGGSIESRGGGEVLYAASVRPPPSPGGAGSGGSILIQVDGPLAQQGFLDVRGGAASRLTYGRSGQLNESAGGAGGYGYVRAETPPPIGAGALGNVLGPPSITGDHFGPLGETDALSGFQSKWYALGSTFPVEFGHYELVASINGQRIVFTDDPANPNPADHASLPVQLWLQGAVLDSTTGGPLGAPGPWRRYASPNLGQASLNDDRATAVRFLILFNRSIAQAVYVERLTVEFFD